MAAFGILAALRERERSGEGQLVDVSMTDGALSWLAMVAARCSPSGAPPRRGELALAGGLALLPALRVRRRLGHARRARAEVLAGVVPRRRARGPDRAAVRAAPGSRRPRRGRGDLRARARAPSGRRSPPSTTAAWSRCSSSTRRSTPSSCARARWSSSSTSPASPSRSGCSACRSSSRARPATRRARPAPALGEHTDEVLREAGYDADGDRGAARRGRGGGPPAWTRCRAGPFRGMSRRGRGC